MDELAATLAEADAVVCATAAPHAVLHARDVAAAMARRDGRRLVLLDLAVPRDVEAAAGSIPGARLYDIDEVQGHAAASIERRAGEVARVRELVEAQVGSFEEWLAARRAARQIRRLRERAEELRQEEVRRVAGRLSDAERAAVDQATRAVVRSLLHGPTVALRRGGESQVGELLASAFARTRLRDGLDPRPGE
jgi:glutamyl-tRNA reductase